MKSRRTRRSCTRPAAKRMIWSSSLTVTVTDADGDTATGTITITYDDDTPGATDAQVGGTVDEDGVPGGIADGPDDVAGAVTVVNGSVASLFLPAPTVP